MSDTAIEARGKAAFMESGLNRLGSRRSKIGARKPGLLYEQGWAEGLTVQEAQEAAERKWAALTPEQKNAWAERGGAGNFAPSEIRAAALGMGMVDGGAPAGSAGAAKPVDNRPTDDRMRARPEVAAAYAAKRGVVGAEKPREINRATGLPMGYRPGDALPVGASDDMRIKATVSETAQALAPITVEAKAPQQMFAGGVPAGEYLSPAELQRRIGERDRASIPGIGMFESDRRIEEKRKMFLADEAKFMAGSNEGLRFKDESAGKPAVVRGRLPFAKRV